MSKTNLKAGDAPEPIAFADLLMTLSALAAPFHRQGEDLALKHGGLLTAELKAAVLEHKTDLLTLCDCRAELTRLHEYLIRLRCEDPPKGTREKAFAYQSAQIEKLAVRSLEIGGTENGWPDPADVFANGDQIDGLREGLVEVASGPYPIPLPPDAVLLPQANFDPFAAGRNYAGQVLGEYPQSGWRCWSGNGNGQTENI